LSRYLLDTNVVSEARKRKPHGAVLSWIQSVPPQQVYIPAVVLGELQAGVEITRSQDAAKARELDAWIDRLAATEQIVLVDADCFRQWARLMHRRTAVFYVDAMIAATALVHDFTVVTRNVRDFAPFRVPLFNPFSHHR
jgi:predicted nucleic acid-binding protein